MIAKKSKIKYRKLTKTYFRSFVVDCRYVFSQLKSFALSENVSSSDVIVSFTTFPKRIHFTHTVVKSLLTQSVKPKKIVLYLDADEMGQCPIPKRLNKLQSDMFEIKYVRGNLRSYNKLIHTLKAYPNSKIITVDDDRIYPRHTIKRLVEASFRHPEKIVCILGTLMMLKPDGSFERYENWKRVENQEQTNIMPLGFSGVLYPPHSLHHDVHRSDLFKALAPTTDDIWFKIMSFLKGSGLKCSGVVAIGYDKDKLIDLYFPDNQTLYSENKLGKNDESLSNIMQHYNLQARDFFEAYETLKT